MVNQNKKRFTEFGFILNKENYTNALIEQIYFNFSFEVFPYSSQSRNLNLNKNFIFCKKIEKLILKNIIKNDIPKKSSCYNLSES